MNWRTSSRSLPAIAAGVPLAMMRPPDKQVTVIGNRGDLAHVVRHDDARDAERVIEAADQPQHDAQRDRVETDERLVIDEELGVHHDRARKRDAARHAARELRGHQACGAAQSHGLELRQHQVPHEPFRQARVFAQRKRDVLVDVEVGQQRAVLEQHAHPATHAIKLATRKRGDVLPVEFDESAVGPGLAGDQAKQRRLATAARAHDGRDCAARKIEVDAREDLSRPPAL